MKQDVYMNRELSWLKFNERVLEEAENEQVPLAERLSFEAIYQSNLDEFFMVRVGSLLDQMILSGDVRENKTNMTPKEQIHQILKAVRKLNVRKDAAYETLMEKLEEIGVSMVDFHRLSIEESAYLEVFFDSEILPLLSPTIVGKRQPFPFLKNRAIYAVCVLQTKSGKEVFVMIELKARFDEENNIEWSRRLEEAGCRVVYGLDGYKVHSKLCLITRKTEAGVEYYTQIGTGNYNEKTSRLYTDLSYMTSRVEIGLEAADVFQALDKGETVKETRHLLVAPNCLQNKVLTMIEEEIHHAKAGEEAYIGLKMNSLTDKKIIDKLIRASEAGVKIDMVIRGINCLIPQVPGRTDNIRVISIVGRFLEHSRIYIFGYGARKKIYIASADFMTRNTVRRVEVATPIYDQEIAQRLEGMFITMLSDNQKAREEDGEGKYHLVYRQEDTPLNSQEFFYEDAYQASYDLEN